MRTSDAAPQPQVKECSLVGSRFQFRYRHSMVFGLDHMVTEQEADPRRSKRFALLWKVWARQYGLRPAVIHGTNQIAPLTMLCPGEPATSGQQTKQFEREY